MHQTQFIAKLRLGPSISLCLTFYALLAFFSSSFLIHKFFCLLCDFFCCRSQPDASIPNHTVPETAISYYKREFGNSNSCLLQKSTSAFRFLIFLSGDLRKGVDFSDPKLPKMTMTTFDGQPYVEHYTLSKLEILPDFGTERNAAPTPVSFSFISRTSPVAIKPACACVTYSTCGWFPSRISNVDTCSRDALCFGKIPNCQARAVVYSSKT